MEEFEEADVDDSTETTQLRGAIEILKEDGASMEVKDPGSLFEVEIPDDDVLLDEQLDFSEQPRKVQEVIGQLAEEMQKDGENPSALRFARTYQTMDGAEIYKEILR